MKLFNQNWMFLKTKFGTEYNDVINRIDEFKEVDIPHDWMIYQVNDLYETSTGWYVKHFTKEEVNYSENGRTVVVFDGVYMDSTVYLNGEKLGDWKYGYSTFSFDMTDYICDGENELIVQVRYQSPNTRWYSGAGIYRNVWIHNYNETYIPLDGLYVSAKPGVGSKYIVRIELECGGNIDSISSARFSINQNNNKVVDLGTCSDLTVKEDGRNVFYKEVTLDISESGIQEWDIESPNCYELSAELYAGNSETPVDTVDTTIGFRRIEFSPEFGIKLNGRKIKLNGVCEHHDFGCLGAAFYKEAMARKFRKLKTMGVNAIRTSHNMPARELMDLADRMGVLVVCESFDMWERSKTEYDYGRFFKEWACKDVRSWVRRDRNHPSLLMWSIGNEIYDTHADDHGQEITRRLEGYVREHDYMNNAPVTIGSNYMPWENAQKCADIIKFAGYNYAERLYNDHRQKYPDWIIYGSETASTVQSRNVYKFPIEEPMLADDDEQCSCLGNSTTSWGAKSTEACITDDRDAKFSMGQFIWTGFDYIGEPTPYHTKNSYFGQIDTAGFEKDTFYIYQAEWTSADKNPMVHVFPYWCFNDGQIIDVRVCSNGASVELIVNGKSLGRQDIDHEHDKNVVKNWKVPYEKGQITAVAYDRNGIEIARETRYSFGETDRLTLTPEKTEILGNGEDLVYIAVSAIDKDGHTVENASEYITVSVEGDGRLLGLDNGDSTDYEEYKGCTRKLFNGKLMIVVGAKADLENDGSVTVRVSSPGLETVECNVNVIKSSKREGICASENICENVENDNLSQLPVMVRQIELKALGDIQLTENNTEVMVEARILPENAADKELIWKVVNQTGVDVKTAKIEVLESAGNVQKIKVTACGDGEFYVRCMSKSSGEKVKIISSLGMSVSGLGVGFTNPYEFVYAGLYTEAIGELGNGNEKGIATSRDGESGIVFENVDFGDYGSDEITVPIFALSEDSYDIEFFLGKPGEEGSELLLSSTYQKPMRWNEYQEETWKFSRRIKGVVTIAIRMRDKVHIKGFQFKHYDKGFSTIDAAECARIYGDSFKVEEKAVSGIGNNVTIAYDNMDFGDKGASSIEICGRTPLASNTVHIHFIHEDKSIETRILEVNGTKEYAIQVVDFEPLFGKGTVEFIFLPGTNFDMESFTFK